MKLLNGLHRLLSLHDMALLLVLVFRVSQLIDVDCSTFLEQYLSFFMFS